MGQPKNVSVRAQTLRLVSYGTLARRKPVLAGKSAPLLRKTVAARFLDPFAAYPST